MKWPTNLEFQDVATFVARFLDFCHKKLELELRDEYRLARLLGVLPQSYRYGTDEQSRSIKDRYVRTIIEAFGGKPPADGLYSQTVKVAIEQQHKDFRVALGTIAHELRIKKLKLFRWAGPQPLFIDAVNFIERKYGDPIGMIDAYLLEVLAIGLGRFHELLNSATQDYLRTVPNAESIRDLATRLYKELEPLDVAYVGRLEESFTYELKALQTITQERVESLMPRRTLDEPILESLRGDPEREIVFQTMVANFADKFLPHQWWQRRGKYSVPATPIVNLMNLMDANLDERSFYRSLDRYKEQRGYLD